MLDEYTLPKLIVIDDEPDMARLISDVADISGFEVGQYFDARIFISEFKDDADIIFLDLVMPDMSGMEVIRFLAENKARARLILMTGFDTHILQEARELAVSSGLNFISAFKKPFRFDELHAMLNQLKAAR
ncbi:MAG: response regulator [Gammaproteobacteria bacterium]|jgi:DNA-binding response OmpR family regulator|nr:response regulator [Gammaproteobacteria bacterium]